MATDEDLHAEGLDCLSPYRVVVTGSHPEYHSTRMWESLKAYSETGGRLMYLGGNGFYWHIAWHEALPGVIEVRKADGTRDWEVEPGELHHAFDGERSGLLRLGGRPLQSLAGIGMAAFGFGPGAPYRRTAASFDQRAAFIFEGVGEDETIGDFGLICGAAAGIEIDRAEPALGTPPHALVLATSQGLHSDMFRVAIEELMANGFETSGTVHDWVRADMVYFETANGGGGVLDRVDHLVRSAFPPGLRQQRLAHYRKRIEAIHRGHRGMTCLRAGQPPSSFASALRR